MRSATIIPVTVTLIGYNLVGSLKDDVDTVNNALIPIAVPRILVVLRCYTDVHEQ